MNRLFYDEDGDLRFGVCPQTVGQSLGIVFAAIALAVQTGEPLVGLGVAAVLTQGMLHKNSRGRTIPAAAWAFLVCGPVAGVLISIPVALMAAGSESGRWQEVSDGDVGKFALAMCGVGVLGATIASMFVASLNRDEWFNDDY